jgi:AraC-like DNA-binding protein
MAPRASLPDGTQDWLVPVYNAALFAQEATRQGVDRRQLIKGTGFSLKDLEDSDTLKTYDQIVALIDNARRLCPLPGLGLRIGRDQSPTQWGILGYAMMCCKTVRHMMAMLIKYHRIAASMAEFYFREEREFAYLEIRPPGVLHDALATVVEEHFSSVMSGMRLLTGRMDIRPTELRLSYAKPDYARLYGEVFGCPVHFSRPSNTLVLEKKWLNLPVTNSSFLSSQMAERICAMQLKRQYVEHDVVHRVRYLLLEHTSTFPDAEEIASILHMTSRTLRNRLHAQGTSFQAILDNVRQQLAINYLEQTDLSVDYICGLVGFNDASNFRRAFRQWTGMNPSDLRESRSRSAQPVSSSPR